LKATRIIGRVPPGPPQLNFDPVSPESPPEWGVKRLESPNKGMNQCCNNISNDRADQPIDEESDRVDHSVQL